MALNACPECRREISNLATTCPGCGFPNEKMMFGTEVVAPEDWWKRKSGAAKLFWGVGIVVLALGAADLMIRVWIRLVQWLYP